MNLFTKIRPIKETKFRVSGFTLYLVVFSSFQSFKSSNGISGLTQGRILPSSVAQKNAIKPFELDLEKISGKTTEPRFTILGFVRNITLCFVYFVYLFFNCLANNENLALILHLSLTH